jgi:EAL domain-containing protein (putative c-di-GMP-specific phosphodiesterase class I)
MRAPSEAIAEGVESETQRQMLLQMGCRKAQGYLFARPMVMAEFMHFLGGPLAVCRKTPWAACLSPR